MYAIFMNWMRTIVPLAVGWALSAAHFLGLNPDSTTVAGLVTAGLTAVYYTAFRLLEHVGDRISNEPLRLVAGVLLGWVKPPQPAPAPVRRFSEI